MSASRGRPGEFRRGADGRDWEEVRLLGSRPEADLVQGLLESSGIATWVAADDAGAGVFPGASRIGYPVLVPAEQAAEARDLLDAEIDTEGGPG